MEASAYEKSLYIKVVKNPSDIWENENYRE